MTLLQDWGPRSKSIEYSMTFRNDSINSWNFCCFQKDPGILDKGALSAAWFVAQTVHPTTVVTFKWNISYGLSWAQSGTVGPGIRYTASQNWDVDFTDNTVNLVKSGGSYTFAPPTGPYGKDPKTAFQIVQDNSIVPSDGVGIGISMLITGSSAGEAGLNTIYATSAQKNITEQFVVTPKYYVVFARTIQPSEILDVTSLTNVVEVPYIGGTTSNAVTLDGDNKWHVAKTKDVNQKYIDAGGSGGSDKWWEIHQENATLLVPES